MVYRKQLGVFARTPEVGKVKTRLVPPLTAEEACALYEAFVGDLFARLQKLKKLALTVFYAGDTPGRLTELAPSRAAMVAQSGEDLGVRMAAAFDHMLAAGAPALIIGSDSPDVPLQYLKRAYIQLKNKDVVIGPSADGGYYLIGLSRPAPHLFTGVDWGTGSVLAQTLDAVEKHGDSLSVLPLWYDVDTEESLDVLATLNRARALGKSTRLRAVESVLERIRRR